MTANLCLHRTVRATNSHIRVPHVHPRVQGGSKRTDDQKACAFSLTHYEVKKRRRRCIGPLGASRISQDTGCAGPFARMKLRVRGSKFQVRTMGALEHARCQKRETVSKRRKRSSSTGVSASAIETA